jgi:hypothetical protein
LGFFGKSSVGEGILTQRRKGAKRTRIRELRELHEFIAEVEIGQNADF